MPCAKSPTEGHDLRHVLVTEIETIELEGRRPARLVRGDHGFATT
jgi:hypothetical protein